MTKMRILSYLSALCWSFAASTYAQILFVSEYSTGNLRGFDYSTGSPVTLPAGYSPIAGSSSGADGMTLGDDGRLYVNRADGTISRRSADGTTFSTFVSIAGVNDLLDLTRNSTHLFATRYNYTTIYRVAFSDASVTTISGPAAAVRFDGVRIGPDNRLYAVDSSNGNIFAYDFNLSTWSTFLNNTLAGDASQLEFGGDGRVFLSRTIGGQARIYSYTLNSPGDYASGLNPASETLIGSFGNTTATGIRIGPDNRLYANAFNTGEIWRSNVGITSMESSAFLTGLSYPGSIYFAAIPEPSALWLIITGIVAALFLRSRSLLKDRLMH
jgi:hypothetical protein